MALLAHPAFRHPALVWIRNTLQSRLVLGVSFGIASALTVLAIILAAFPPTVGPLGPPGATILTLLWLNMALILLLLASVALRIVELLEARASDAGARLHMRFVMLFAGAALVPALVIFVFYGVLVTQGQEKWFSDRVQTVVQNSATVFQAYVEEQTRYIGEHVTNMGSDLNGEAGGLQARPGGANSYLAALASYHAFPSAYLVDSRGRVFARAEAQNAPPFQAPTPSAFAAADAGEVYIMNPANADVWRALYRLRSFDNGYLYISHPLQRGIVARLRDAEGALLSFNDISKNRGRIQRIFALSYMDTALLVRVGAIWVGMGAANTISGPIARLVQAAGRVAGGDLSARVDADADPDEIAVLSRAFNSMTHDLQAQQEALRRAGEEAEARRQFIETVLSEVSAGVIGLDPDGRISVANRQADFLLALPGDLARGHTLAQVAPEFADLVAAARGGDAEEEIDVTRGRDQRRLRVRVSQSEGGLVLTFDDVTRLVAAQRNAAWRDVARRIAHEIKNPLTPIQLSAERLRRKYRKDIAPSELETFDRCTDTIVRQVGDIGRMVDEFSAFARMPAPKFVRLEADELLRAAVFAQRVASPDIEVDLEDPAAVALFADSRMIGQALTNVLKNASEAIEARRVRAPKVKGRIRARLISDASGVSIEVEDNGIGLPAKDRDRLTEPYVTTREKGTGLGLAIVKRIMEDHGGELELADARSGQGAMAILRLPAAPPARIAKPAVAVST